MPRKHVVIYAVLVHRIGYEQHGAKLYGLHRSRSGAQARAKLYTDRRSGTDPLYGAEIQEVILED